MGSTLGCSPGSRVCASCEPAYWHSHPITVQIIEESHIHVNPRPMSVEPSIKKTLLAMCVIY